MSASLPLTALSLGATLYMPATRTDLWDAVSGSKYPALRSLVICLEDAVAESDLPQGLAHLQQLLHRLATCPRQPGAPLIFVRPRHQRMAAQLCEWPLIHQIDGMVLPKFDASTEQSWRRSVLPELLIMPTLESASVFDPGAMRDLRDRLLEQPAQILALRIGGNDLLACLGLRRPRQFTLYQTPIGPLIAQLAGIFLPSGLALTAPVCEYFQDSALLEQELVQDLLHGLSAKTIIHPCQIDTVHRALQVDPLDHAAAQAILRPTADAVFQQQGAMLEPATHRAWAQRVVARAAMYGLAGTEDQLIAWPGPSRSWQEA